MRRVICGGSWYDNAGRLQSTYRGSWGPARSGDDVGFRLCYELKGSSAQANSQCQHEFKEYQGFNEFYHYCIKCDKKKKST